MSGLSTSPYLCKGALCQGPLIIEFQYNPETLTRSLTANAVNPQGKTSDSLRLWAPPTETIQLEALLDATDALTGDHGDSSARAAAQYGVYPALTALELLLYPASARMILNAALAEIGLLEVVSAAPSPTLFVWGARRVVAVRLTQFNVTEEQFDAALNPTRARVSLGMQVLTYEDLGMTSIGGALALRNHIAKEVLVASASKYLYGTALAQGTQLAGSAYNSVTQTGGQLLAQGSQLASSAYRSAEQTGTSQLASAGSALGKLF